MSDRERVLHYDDAANAALDCAVEGGLEIAGPSDFEELRLKPEHPDRSVDFSRRQGSTLVRRVP